VLKRQHIFEKNPDVFVLSGANILAVLYDGTGVRKWEHDPSITEKDYSFELPGE
jgi:hypothetical protein